MDHFRFWNFKPNISDAQQCLEGDKYVNISLIVLCIKRLHGTLHSALAASVHNQELYDLLHDMIIVQPFVDKKAYQDMHTGECYWIHGPKKLQLKC